MVRVCVFPFRSFESFSVNSFSVNSFSVNSFSCFCFCSAKLTSLASLYIASLAATLTKLDITRCPKLLDVGVVSGLTMLVELGIYECPAVTGVLIVSELPRLTHLSIDLSRATREHLGLCVAFSSTATLRLTSRSGGMHIGLPSGLFRIRTGLKSPWQIEDCEDS